MNFLAATAEDVFKSVGSNADSGFDSRGLIALAAIAVGVVMLLALAGRRRGKKIVPGVVNHPAKLLKEVQKKIGLRASEVRQLKALAEQEQVGHALVLMICPSVLKKAAQRRRGVAEVAEKVAG